MAQKRMSPKQQEMSRADSLQSIRQYGRVVRPGEAKPATPKKGGFNPFAAIKRALSGKKK